MITLRILLRIYVFVDDESDLWISIKPDNRNIYLWQL